MAVCNVTEILEDGACWSCLSDYQLQIVQAQLLCDVLATGGGGGGLPAAANEGANFCFTGTAPNQVLRIKNLTTGLANSIHMEGADGDQGLSYGDGVAC